MKRSTVERARFEAIERALEAITLNKSNRVVLSGTDPQGLKQADLVLAPIIEQEWEPEAWWDAKPKATKCAKCYGTGDVFPKGIMARPTFCPDCKGTGKVK